MTEGLYNDIWLESDGVRVSMHEITIGASTSDKSGNLQGLSNGIFYITKLASVQRALVQWKGSGLVGTSNINVLGYSGNQVRLGIAATVDANSGIYQALSGHSGNTVTFLVMGQ